MNEICTLQCGMLVAAPSGFVLSPQDAIRVDGMQRPAHFPWQRNHSSAQSSHGTAIGQTKVQVQKALGYAWQVSQHTHTSLEYPQKHCDTSHTPTTLDKTTRGRNRHRSSVAKTNYSVNKSQYTGLYMHPEAISCRVYKSNVSTCTTKHSLKPGCSVAGSDCRVHEMTRLQSTNGILRRF